MTRTFASYADQPLHAISYRLEKTFHLRSLRTHWRIEILAGFTTYIALSYTLVVTPKILSQAIYLEQPGDLFGQLVFATALVSSISTIFMGCFANLPFALAPGIGLNSLFVFSVVTNLKLDWHLALAAVLLQGLLLTTLSLSQWRERLIASIPSSLKYAIVAGIGLFLAYIAISGDPEPPTLGMGIVVASATTKTTLGSFQNPVTLTALFGLMMTAIMTVRRVKGGILWSILSTALLGWILGVAPWPQGIMALPPWPADIFGQAIAGFSYLTIDQLGKFVAAVFLLSFVTMLDSIGSMVGLIQQLQSGQRSQEANHPQAGKAMLALGMSNTFGALTGVSPIVPYLESAAGIAAGGRSGLTSIITAVMLMVSVLFIPLLSAVPTFATAPVLVLIGVLMMAGSVKSINWDDLAEAIPAFLVILTVPTTFSLADGLALGFISYVLIKTFQGKFYELKWPCILIALFCGLYFALITL